MKLSIILITYNGFSFVKECITSIYQEKIRDVEIIIVDNASTDKGLSEILSDFPKVICIKNDKNFGFAKGVNMGLRSAKGEYVLILNPDTKILPGTLSYMIHSLDSDKNVQLAGCKIFNRQEQVQQSAGYAFPNILSHIYEYNYLLYKTLKNLFPHYHPLLYSLEKHKEKMKVQHVIGAFLFIRKSILRKVGYFDERFFLYREETDFCKRLNDKHYTIAYLPFQGGVIHEGAGSSKIKITQASHLYMEATYLYFQKYHSQLYVFISYFVGFTSSILSLMALVIFAGIKGNKKSVNVRENIFAYKKIIAWHATKGLQFLLSL